MGKKNKLRRPCLFAVVGTGIGIERAQWWASMILKVTEQYLSKITGERNLTVFEFADLMDR